VKQKKRIQGMDSLLAWIMNSADFDYWRSVMV
jgi:hypothetical protein